MTTIKITGRIFLSNGLPAEGLPIKLYKHVFGKEQLLGTAETAGNGVYTLSFEDTSARLPVTMKTTTKDGKEIPLMNTKYVEKDKEEINLVAPAGLITTAPEYNRLMASVEPYVKEKRLGEAKEGDQQQDLSFLFQETGWDTRLLALAALADKRSAETGIKADILYGLFRTGLPTGTDQLSKIKESAIEKALEKANKAGIVQVSAEDGKKAVKAFAAKKLRDTKLVGGVGKVDDFFKGIGLSTETANELASIFFTEHWEGASIWQKAKEKGISSTDIDKLKVQGKLSFLTLNNPALTNKLQNTLGDSTELSELAGKGYYKASQWKKDLTELTDNDEKKMRDLIPLHFSGSSKDALDAYANDMARKIRVAYPTQSLGAMITNDDITLGKDHEKVKKGVSQLLKNAATLKPDVGNDHTYVPGSTSFHKFLKENRKQLVKGISTGAQEQIIAEVKKLTRLYQLSPSDESMQILYNLGITSAFDVAAITHQDWIRFYGKEFITIIEAEQIHAKATETTAVLYNFYTSGQQINNQVPTGVTAGPAAETEVVKNDLIKRFPTMEALFGSIDFCECEHCRSVLSPAAYLVDILRFLDPDDNEWESMKLLWKRKHNNTDYTGEKPFKVLTARRADIPLIPLNCENTHTALPYIDIVNEILECYVAGRNMETVAHDTGSNTSADLLAEPQHIIPRAYEVLSEEVYPLTLPFDYNLELVRHLSDHFDIPFWNLLDTFRKTNSLFAAAPAAPYYFNDVFMEYLGLTAKEYELCTNPAFDKWFLLYGYTSENDALSAAVDVDTKQVIGIVSAKTLSRKLGITYKELVQVLKLHFINPALEELAILRSLQITTEEVHRWKSAQGFTPFTPEESVAFEAKLTAATTVSFDARAWLDRFWNSNLFGQTILLFDTEPGGNFDKTRIQFANGQPLTSLEWVKLHVFVRLWKKLGWQAEELDAALVNFMPKDSAISTANFGEKCKTALTCLSHLKRLQALYPLGKTGIQTWSSIWGSLAAGARSVYQQYFLSGSIKNEDPIYNHPLGKYLQHENAGAFVPFTFDKLLPEDRTTGNVGLVNHLASVQSALGLSADEIKIILAENNMATDTAPLSMTVLQLLNGFKVLKNATRLTIQDLISLQQLSGLQPLKQLAAAPFATLEEDYPYTQTLRFLEIAAIIKETGVSVRELNILLRHKLEPEDPAVLQEKDLVSFIRSLAGELNRINLEQSAPPDSTGYTDEFMQERLLLALSPGIAGTFLSMWNDTIVLTAYESTLPADKLPDILIEGEQRLTVAYDATRQLQTLTLTGMQYATRLAGFTTKLNELEALPANNPKRITTAQKTLALSLLDNIRDQAKVFYEEHLLKPIFRNDAAYAFNTFFPVVNTVDQLPAQLAMKNAKRIALVNATLLFLKHKFAEEAVVNQLASAFNLDGLFTKYLLNDTNVAAIDTKTLQQVYNTIPTEGVSIHFIKNAAGELAGPPAISASASIQSAVAPAGTTRIVMGGFLEPQVAGAYRFFIKGSKQGMKMRLSLPHLPKPFIETTLVSDNSEVSELINLEAGVAYKFSLDLIIINGGDVSISVQSEVLPKGELNRMKLIPQELVSRIGKAHTLLGKIAGLLSTFEFTEKEVRYLSGNAADHYQFSFRDLPVVLVDHKSAAGKILIEKLFRQWLGLISYTTCKKEIAGGKDNLISLFEMAVDNQPATLNNLAQQLAVLTRRDQVIIEDISRYYGYDAFSFSRGQALERVWQAVKLVHTMGISANAVTRVLPVVSKDKTFTEKFDLAIAFRQALRSRYPRDTWNQIAKSVFDKLRQQKRDALSASIMHRQKFGSMGQLFEYFLIDPGMEPVIQTSRIRLAMASVQSFIQRCLLNLEPGVSPSLINRGHWDWMKRYRVWEANRKIFLFPENWLEPEFRDNKTHLFEELEGAIMQGDINKDLVERVFYGYLKGLEKMARLNMVAMYCEEDPIDVTHNKIHVIAKEYSQPYYYYRSYADREWTPWVPIPDQIEGEHLALIKWQDRLHVFWLTFFPKTESSMTDEDTVESAAGRTNNSLLKKSVDIQLNWCEYFQGEWQPRQTGGFENAMIVPVSPRFTTDNVYVHASIETGTSPDTNETIEKAVLIHVSHVTADGPNMAFRLVSKLAQPASSPDYHKGRTNPPYSFTGSGKTKYKHSGGSFKVRYTLSIVTVKESVNGVVTTTTTPGEPVDKELLKFAGTQDMSFLFCNDPIPVTDNAEINKLVSPFFFEDNENSITLYAEPDLVEKTTVSWEEWIIREIDIPTVFDNDDYWIEIPVQPFIPYFLYEYFQKLIDPKINPWVNIKKEQLVNPVRDWATKPDTILQFDEGFLGPRGGVILERSGQWNGSTNFDNNALGGKQVTITNSPDANGMNAGVVLIKEHVSVSTGINHGVKNPYAGDLTSINIVGAGGLNMLLAGKTNGMPNSMF